MRSRRAAVDEIVELGRALYVAHSGAEVDHRSSPVAVVSLFITGVAPAGTLDGGSRGARRPNP